jgi:hypothetical protein
MVGKSLRVKNLNELKNKCKKILGNHFETCMDALDLFDETHDYLKGDGQNEDLLKEAISKQTLQSQCSLTMA